MENKNVRYLLLRKNTNQTEFGVFVVEKQKNNCKGTICLFGEKEKRKLLIDNFSQIFQFEISNLCEDVELPGYFFDVVDFACVVFNKEDKPILFGREKADFEKEQMNKFLIAVEKEGQLEHFNNICEKLCREKSVTFWETIETDLIQLFCLGIPEPAVEQFIPNSKWVRIYLETCIVSIGVQFDGKKIVAVGVAFPVFEKCLKPSRVDEDYIFIAKNKNFPEGFGWWVVMQDANTGKSIEIGHGLGL